MGASSTLTFLNPFEGPPVPIKLAGVLTFDPEVHFKLNGAAVSALFAEEALLPWYRKAIRLQTSKAPNRERRAHKLMSELATLRPAAFGRHGWRGRAYDCPSASAPHLLWSRAEAVIREASHVNELIPLRNLMS
jgi:hypothetical protein